jgi:rubrerythrin
MDERERINALDLALNNELNEHKFYMKNAERTTNPLGKAMFRQIGNEELEHYERLKQLHEEWTKRGKWPNTLPLKVRDTEIKNVLSEFVSKAETSAPSESDDLAAIRTAIDFEAKGMEYYASLRDAINDKKESEFFGLLSSIEREHYLSLKDAEEYFIDPAGWYRSHEHTGLD